MPRRRNRRINQSLGIGDYNLDKAAPNVVNTAASGELPGAGAPEKFRKRPKGQRRVDNEALIDRAVAEIFAWDELRGAPVRLPESMARLLASRMHALFGADRAECNE